MLNMFQRPSHLIGPNMWHILIHTVCTGKALKLSANERDENNDVGNKYKKTKISFI